MVPRLCALAVLLATIRTNAVAQSLSGRIEGETLRVALEGARLISSDPLQKLHDGVPVTYVLRLTALNGPYGSAVAKVEYRFVLSYDIFEEKFQVSRTRPTKRVVSHLTLAAAEAACLEALELPIRSINATKPFWLRFEYETEDSAPTENSAVSLGGLVEIFSRKTSREPSRLVVESGPFVLSNLPRGPGRGTINP